MGNYREIKKQLKHKEQKLEKANNQTKILDNSSNDIKKILNNLKSTKLSKNNMVISNEDVQKIKNYTEDVKDITQTAVSYTHLDVYKRQVSYIISDTVSFVNIFIANFL